MTLMRLALAVLMLLAAGCGTVTNMATGVQGSGVELVEERDVAGIDAVADVRAGGAIDVTVTVDRDAEPSVVVAGDDNIVPLVIVEARGGTLHVEVDGSYSTRNPLGVEITLPSLDAARLSGSGGLAVDGVDADSFAAELAGSGDLELVGVRVGTLTATLAGSGDLSVDGTADDAKLYLAGSGDLDAAKLDAGTLEVDVAGSGNVAARAAGSADVSIAGSGDVDLTAGPAAAVTQSVVRQRHRSGNLAPMNLLLLGGTGLISVGILRALDARRRGGEDVAVTCLNRGKGDAKSPDPLPDWVTQVHADRNDADAVNEAVGDARFDGVIDMICFTEKQAAATADLCRKVGAGHLLFCSTVCTYGTKIPPGVVISESFPQEPISDYGRGKVACERLLHDCGDFATTTIRPSHTYGEGGPLIDQLEPDPPTWSRMKAGLPVPIADGGMGLWNSTHRDDVGVLFAHAAMNEVTYGRAYNATVERVFTWRDYYAEAAEAMGWSGPQLVSMSADRIVEADPKRFGLLREITRFHGPYTSAAARRDVPEFDPQVGFAEGARRTLTHLERAGRLKPAEDDVIERLLARAA